MMKENLISGVSYSLTMEFEGYLNDKLKGFYRSSYSDDNKNTRYLAVSQFEPADAHLAFPCFDEPSLKATFDVHLAREESRSSISNMPLKETVPVEGQPGWVWDVFETSVRMSTYLVAFVVSDFSFVQSDANDHVHFRVWARDQAIGQADYAVATGPSILTIYEEYFDVPFPLPKQDMIALPDFSAGAMENWGLVTYRERLLLLDPNDFAASDMDDVARVIAHELAHQWFGNLVTLKWWNDLWLNEGFATFVSYIGTSHLEPDWKTMERFVTEEMQGVMALDSLESSHPISVTVDSASQVNELFDGISYAKGASIIRMMMYFLKEENFKKGIHNYLVDKQYDNAEQDDLWLFLTQAVEGMDLLPPETTVKTIMDTWTLQMGFPVIKVERVADGTSATVTQNRFLLVKNVNSTDDHDYRWWVPLTYTSEDNPDFLATHPSAWMADTDKQVTVTSLPASDKWVIFNVQETGYYKVNYDDNNWQLLTAQLEKDHTPIHLLNRAQLIDDSLDLARASELKYDTPLSLISYLKHEEEYIPWEAALSNLGYVEQMFTRQGGYGDLRTYVLSLLEPLYTLVGGFEEHQDDPQLLHYKRSLALSWTCKLGYKDCVDNSVSLYQAWMASNGNTSAVSPNVRNTVYCTGIAEGGEEAWNFAWEQYLTTNVANQKDMLLSALGCAKEVWLLSRYLDTAFTEGAGIRRQDASTVFRVVARNDIGRDLAWSYLRDRWDFLSNYFGSFTTLGDLVLAVSNEFNTREELNQLKMFKEEHASDLNTAERAVNQAIEKTANNIAWMDNNYQTIVNWLHDHLHPSL
ncbi:aminopeptidase N-like [Portunus trituberculatus]|uniref:aminopeptidase N-like n=1 Tax=Portunus trituberculatus TaxID=210409 RepID=UPI001E1D1404|nr:aminopeptidase N-like [Portunus trituberculatus]